MATATVKAKKSRGDSVASGAVYLLGAQFMLMIAGYAIHAFLGRTLQPSMYGIFGVVMAFLVWMEVSLTGGFPYAIRKFGSQEPSKLPEIARTALKGQVVYAAILLLIAEAAAPFLASAMHEPRLTWLVRIAALDIPIYALYFSYLGILNGRRDFLRQSVSMGLYAGFKVVGVLILVLLGWGILGALIGNILASVIGFGSSALIVGKLGKGRCEPMRTVVTYAAGTAAIGIIFTLLISVDVFCIKALIRDGNKVGYYVAAATLARAPFLVFVGISAATLPAVSKAISANDRDLARTYIAQALRLHVILLLPITALMSATSARLVTLVYGREYASAGPLLSILAASFMLFGYLNTLNNMLLAAADTRKPLIASAVSVVVDVLLVVLLVRNFGFTSGAIAALITSAVGLIIAWMWTYRRYGQFADIKSISRAVVASAAIYALALIFKAGGILLLPVYGVLGAFYIVLLYFLGELTRADLVKITSIFGGNRG